MDIKNKVRKDKSFFITEIECITGGEKDLGKKFADYRKKWNEVCEKKHITEFPMHLDVEVNLTCNYKCVMCPRTVLNIGDKENKKLLMDVDLYKKILDESSDNNLYGIDVSFLGEPLLRKDLPELLKYAKNKGILDIRMHTNGSLLNESVSKKLLDAGLIFIQIALDANSRETYEKIRVGGDFDKVKQNILNFLRLKKERGLSYPIVKLSFVRMNVNENEIKEFIEFWKDKVNYITIQEYINPYNLQKNNLKPEESNYRNDLVDENFICTQLFQRLVIRWDGTVIPCCNDFNNKLKLGNVKENTLKEIWDSEKLKHVRTLHLNHEYYKIPVCKTCYESRVY